MTKLPSKTEKQPCASGAEPRPLVTGLLGARISESLSPAIHAAFGDPGYRLFQVAPAELEAFLRETSFHGLNVTMPYKKAVLPYLAETSETARKTGAVNTVVCRPDGTLFGENTDVFGFERLVLGSGVDLSGKRVLVLGTGGGAAAVRVAVETLGGTPVLLGRNGGSRIETPADADTYEVLVNATPVGMSPDNGETPVDLTAFPHLTAVFDLIYSPLRTALVLEARQRGIPAFGGLRMLVYQAKKSAELWRSEEIPDALAEKVLSDLLLEQENLVLIGMPGAGKSALGEELAASLHRPFVDTDLEIRAKTGRTPEKIIEEDGEDAFRAIETEVLKETGRRRGIVIAAGGGAVTRHENFRSLHENGFVVEVERDLEELDRRHRPLSSENLDRLYAERASLYRAFRDAKVRNSGSIRDTANLILRAFLTHAGRGENV